MLVKENIDHFGEKLIFGENFNTKEGIDFFCQCLGRLPEKVQGEMKRMVESNKVIIDSTAEVEESVISITTNIGTVLMFNLYWMALALSTGQSDEEVSKVFMRFFNHGLYEEKLNTIEAAGRIIYDPNGMFVTIDGNDYIPSETFNPIDSILGDEINTYIFERLVACSAVECLVDKDKVLKNFLNLINNSTSTIQ